MLLNIYEILSSRMNLEKEDYFYYINLKKGFKGEKRFDEHTEKYKEFCLILNDLLIEIKRSYFQIDSLLICADKILLFEIKNYEGEHVWSRERLRKMNGTGMENPSLQLQKTRIRLELLLEELGYQMKVEAFVVYINPNFTMLGVPNDQDFLLHSQLSGYFRKLKMTTAPNDEQRRLADSIMNLHKSDYPNKILPEYGYKQLSKGIPCTACGKLLKTYSGYYQSCTNCGERVSVKCAIKTSISDFRILFPNEKVTSARMADWCGVGLRDRIYRILREECQPNGSGNSRYYL